MIVTVAITTGGVTDSVIAARLQLAADVMDAAAEHRVDGEDQARR
jgi:hypothetical protein